VASLVTGCATGPKQEEPQRLVWPSPPLTARIEFLRSIASEEDVRKDTTATQKLINWLSGVKPPAKHILEPMGIAVSDDGQRLYVSNFGRQAVFAFDFRLKTFSEIGPLAHPLALALDAQGQLYVVEQGKKQISIFDQAGNRLRSITHPDIVRPSGIAIDRTRARIYVSDTGKMGREGKPPRGHDIKIFNMEGELIDTIGKGFGDAPGQFRFPTYLTLDASGNVYVTDTLNSRVQVFDPDGNYVKKFGERGNAWGMFDKPKGVAFDSFGNVYVTDSGWSNVQIFNQQGQVLLFFGGRGQIPGMLKNPTAITIDANNNIYVADFVNHRINIYRLVNTTAEDSFTVPPAKSEARDEATPKQAGAQIDNRPTEGGDI
jgi:DNA-binding beta-propeller fold protein YncE